MYYVAVTLRFPKLRVELDADLPWDLPLPLLIQEILPNLLRQEYGLSPGQYLGSPNQFLMVGRFVKRKFYPIMTQTLRMAGVYDGNFLDIRIGEPPWGIDPFRFYLVRMWEETQPEEQDKEVFERIYLFTPRVRLGRHDMLKGYITDVDLSAFVAERYISRRHALLRWRRGRWYIRDRGSRNGIWVNGQRLLPKKDYPLKPGDRISFAQKLFFRLRDAARDVDNGEPPSQQRDVSPPSAPSSQTSPVSSSTQGG